MTLAVDSGDTTGAYGIKGLSGSVCECVCVEHASAETGECSPQTPCDRMQQQQQREGERIRKTSTETERCAGRAQKIQHRAVCHSARLT